MSFEVLSQKIDNAEALVGIIGLGYVGLPLAETLHRGGLRVLGFDVDADKIDMLDRGENYLRHLGAELTAGLAARFATVPGERISPNARCSSSTTTKVALGETFGVPSAHTVAT